MKYTHVFKNTNEDPGLATLVIEDSNSSPYVPGSAETTTNGALTWEGRDFFVSDCAGCAWRWWAWAGWAPGRPKPWRAVASRA